MEVILVSIGVIALCVVMLGVKVFFVKNGKFPSLHLHDNPAMREHGIKCVHSEELESEINNKKHKNQNEQIGKSC